MSKVTLACVQMDCRIGEPGQNLRNLIDHVYAASDCHARLVVFPECILTGYCYDSLEEAIPVAETADGPCAEAMARACEKAGVYAVYGFIERDEDDYYNSAMVVGPEGPVGTYRKVHLPFLGIDRFLKRGDRPFKVVDLPIGRIGVNICYDINFPEAARVLKLGGAQLLLLPTNWPTGAHRTPRFTTQARASENHFFVAAVDRIGVERGWQFIGTSQIVDYNGDTMAQAGPDGTEALLAEIDMDKADRNKIAIIPGKYEIDRVGDRRPEFYGPVLNSPSRTS